MSRWKLWFVLLMLLPFCTDSTAAGELLVKSISKEPDVTQICTNDTLDVIILIVCRIHTVRSRGEECQLLYRLGEDFVHGCDSRFTLMKENHTVFLHLISLTPEDSGNYTCECITSEGTYKLQLNVTVEGGHKVTPTHSASVFFRAVIGVPVLIIVSGAILGLICSKNAAGSRRRHHVPVASYENAELYTQAEYTEHHGVCMQSDSRISKIRAHTVYFSVGKK